MPTKVRPSDSFVTGGHAYGKPTPESDIDLVVRVSCGDGYKIREAAGIESDTDTVRFGKLNVILAETDLDWAVWLIGTERMRRAKRAFDKVEAKAVFDELRDMVGLRDNY